MTIPVLVLLGYAAWTIFILIVTVGVYRWSHILSGKAKLCDFPADTVHGSDWYRRAMRAHANCIENLPIYTAIVVAMLATQVVNSTLDKLAISILIFRILQSITHIAFIPTNFTAAIRFSFFILQIICMVWMGIYIVVNM